MALFGHSLFGRWLGVNQANGDLIGKDGLLMTRAPDNRVLAVTSSALTATRDDHDGKLLYLNRAAGITVTLPAASGSGTYIRFFVGATASGGSYIIKVANSSDTVKGVFSMAQDSGDTAVLFEASGTNDTWTGNGTTTGGIIGDYLEFEDVASNVWRVTGFGSGTGVEATPFSATV